MDSLDELKMEDQAGRPLNNERSEIRLLALHAATCTHAPIECSLQNASLNDKPHFMAISYVWGDAYITEDIIVDGYNVPITTNLASALRHLRAVFGQIVLWADAVCINQNEIAERSHQVRLMRSIYEKAARVVSWIGQEEDDSTLALQTLERMAEALRIEPGEESLSWLREFPELCRYDNLEKEADPVISNRAWIAIHKILSRSYWTRLWILQETALASDLYLMCGMQLLRWDNLDLVTRTCMSLGDQNGQNPPTFMDKIIWRSLPWVNWSAVIRLNYLRDTWKRPSMRVDLFRLVTATTGLESSDPRDRIYSLIGLADTDITPDYGKTWIEVYTEFGCESIKYSGNLDILQYAGIGTIAESHIHSHPSLPTWIPDWQLGSKGKVRDIDVLKGYNGMGEKRREPKVAIRGRILSSSGIIYDEVAEAFSEELTGDPANGFIFCYEYGLEEDTLYPTGISRIQALFRFFLGDVDILSNRRLEASSRTYYYLAAVFLHHTIERNIYDLGLDRTLLVNRGSTSALRRSFLGNRINAVASSQWPTTEEVEVDGFSVFSPMVRRMSTLFAERRGFLTKKGFLGIGPPDLLEGDVISFLRDCRMPVILRKVDSHYVLVGTCFVLGLMDGEAMQAAEHGTAQLQEIEIH
jgi:hypothetical protein